MLEFDIVKKVNPEKTFRVASIMGKFDLQSNQIEERFTGNIQIPEKWQIGLIVGKSGTGKTTIAKQLFPDSYITNFEYKAEAILDDMPENRSIEEISKTFNSVGFSSPPSWLKSYYVLSNGEKMRVDLARAILEENKLFVFDEFTSVVDRQVARIGSFAMQKAIRKTDKQFIAVTCHSDVIDWLLPDWIFNTDDMTFRIQTEEQKKNRPELQFRIWEQRDRKQEHWKIFSRYHYLSHVHSKSATMYLCSINDKICGICSVINQPLANGKSLKKIHRLVILPDYQGLSIGILFLNKIASIYRINKQRIGIVTSSPSLIYGLRSSADWICSRLGRGSLHNGLSSMNRSSSINRITASFEYIGV